MFIYNNLLILLKRAIDTRLHLHPVSNQMTLRQAESDVHSEPVGWLTGKVTWEKGQLTCA